MDEKKITPEQSDEKPEETIADAIIGSIIDVDIESVSDEQLAEAIIAGASTLVGMDEHENNTEDKNKESKGEGKKAKKKLNGTFFLGLISVFFGFLCLICCCTPFSFPIFLPIQLLFLALAITFLVLDKKYNGHNNFSVSAIISTIYSICIVLATLVRVAGSLLFGLAIKPLLKPYLDEAITFIASTLGL
ncbi:MAG: hypothetical protein J6A96_03975 [Clostridia bacterium]|nr:hypothetical protein [Clostridia bacterium]